MVTMGRNERAPIPATLVFIGACVHRHFTFIPCRCAARRQARKKQLHGLLHTGERRVHSSVGGAGSRAFQKTRPRCEFKTSQLTSRAASAGRRRSRCDLFGPGSRQCAPAKRSGEVHRRLAATLHLSIMGRKGHRTLRRPERQNHRRDDAAHVDRDRRPRSDQENRRDLGERRKFYLRPKYPCHSDRDNQWQDFSRNSLSAEYFEGARRRTQLC